jgi:hypothetical protein
MQACKAARSRGLLAFSGCPDGITLPAGVMRYESRMPWRRMHAAYRNSAALSALSVDDCGTRWMLARGVGAVVVFVVVVFLLVVAPVAVVADREVLAACGVVAAGALATSDVEPVEGEEPPHAASATPARATVSTAVAVRAVI